MKPITLLLILYGLLGLLYLHTTPAYEAPDEYHHYALVDEIARSGSLPVQVQGYYTPWRQEGSQPPLYYLTGAALVAGIDRSDFKDVTYNPHAIIGYPELSGNKNHFILPSNFNRAAVNVLRLFSLSLGAVTVWAVYQTTGVVAGSRVALLAAGLTALNPQFLFISASVNNDNMVTALNSLIVWQTVVMLRDGFQTRRSILLSVLVALATISKLSGLVMVLIVALAGVWVAYRRRDLRGLFMLGGWMVAVWLALGAWWYVRNLTLYGELFGTQTMLDIFGRRLPPPPLELVRELTSLTVSYWGLFGWFNLFTFPAFYLIVDAVMLMAVIGLIVCLYRQRNPSALFLMFIFGAGFAALVSWTLQTTGTQGRLLFPYIAATSTLMALGLTAVRVPPFAVKGVLAVCSLAIPFFTLTPEYALPQQLETLPSSATPVDARFRQIHLLGYEVPPERYQVGDTIPVILYWRPQRSSPRDFTLALQLVDHEDRVIAELNSYPGWGKLRTSQWRAGVIYRDSYHLRIPAGAVGSSALRVHVKWWDRATDAALSPRNAQGENIFAVYLPAGGFHHPSQAAANDFTSVEPISFGGFATLRGYRLRDQTLSLLWEGQGEIRDHLTVMAVALSDDVQIMAQGDAPPDLPTVYWREGETYITHHTLAPSGNYQAGEYPVVVAWYRANGERLAVEGKENMIAVTNIVLP